MKTDFHKRAASKDGLMAKCRFCRESEYLERSSRKGEKRYYKPVGTLNRNAKVTDEDVRAIRILKWFDLTTHRRAELFGISASSVSRIDRRENWTHV